ncbi:9804_t:CDS:1, partial [Scutellospora calospora]
RKMDDGKNEYTVPISENEISCEIFEISAEDLALYTWRDRICVQRTNCEPTMSKTVSIDANASDSVKDVKAKFLENDNITCTRTARLLFEGMELEDDYTLSDYDIQPQSTLNIELSINIQ